MEKNKKSRAARRILPINIRRTCISGNLLRYLFSVGIVCYSVLAIRMPVAGSILAHGAEQLSQNKEEIPLPETKDIDTDQDFNFTISPSGQELLFFAHEGERYSLVALNLIKNTVRQQPLSYYDYMSLLVNLSNDCWSQDSQYCIAPVPGSKNLYATVSPEWVIDFSDPKQLQVTRQKFRRPAAIASRTFSNFRQPFTCSDCYPGSELRDKNGNRTRYSSGYFESSVMSLDQRWVYQARNANNSAAAIYAKDTVSSVEKKLVGINSFFLPFLKNSGKVKINRLRLSPNGRYLAFQVTFGQTWISSPTLYIVDITTRALTLIAENVYYDTHWTTNPERLYFYKCQVGGSCGGPKDYLYSIQPMTLREKASKTQPGR